MPTGFQSVKFGTVFTVFENLRQQINKLEWTSEGTRALNICLNTWFE